MKILYIGNKLAACGRTPTTVDTLSKQFEDFLQVVSVSSKFNKIARLWDMCSSIFKHKDVDFVLIDTYSSSAFYYALLTSLCCRFLKKKYILLLHGGNLPYRLDKSPLLSKSLFGLSYLNVSPSDYLCHEFSIRGFQRPILIPNNIPVDEYVFTKRVHVKPRLLWVRSFAKTYNCCMAIEVLHILLKSYPEAELCMVGPDKDGSMQESIDLSERYGIANRLRITGQMTKKEWHALSEKYDIFISTTNFDNTPISVIEAMALGLPVISTNVGGMPYLVKDGEDALLVEKGNAEEMAEKVISLIESPETVMRIVANARKKAESYDWKCVKEQWKAIFK